MAVIGGSYILAMKLVSLSSTYNPAVFVLGSFSTISVVSIYLICGGAIKAIFGYNSNDKNDKYTFSIFNNQSKK